MTDELPSVREELAFLRKASRPGSMEARKVYGCTCTEDTDRARVWNPDEVTQWQADIDLACPAHGRLLERYLEHVNASLGRSAKETREALQQAVWAHERTRADNDNARAERRSLVARFEDAWRGAVAGWRGE